MSDSVRSISIRSISGVRDIDCSIDNRHVVLVVGMEFLEERGTLSVAESVWVVGKVAVLKHVVCDVSANLALEPVP